MRLILKIVLLVLAISCTEIEADLPTAARPVVQAYLVPGHVAEVNVKRETIFLDTDTAINITRLDLTIETGGQRYALTSLGGGNYSNTDLVIEEGKVYKLTFPYNYLEVSATTGIPAKPQGFAQSATVMAVPTLEEGLDGGFPDPIELTWSNPDKKYYLTVVEVAGDNPEQINTGGFTRPAFAFRNDPSNGTRYLLTPQQFQYYSLYRVILYEVTEEYAALYQQNGTSSNNIKTPATNVTNGLGIFTGVNSDTLYVDIRKP